MFIKYRYGYRSVYGLALITTADNKNFHIPNEDQYATKA